MSDQDASTHADPLDALRAQDHRPPSAVWRERVTGLFANVVGQGVLPSGLARWGWGLLALPILVGLGWQSYVATDPPVEASIPLASSVPPFVADGPTATIAGDGVVSVSAAAPIVAEVIVHVAGAVHNPGLVTAQPGWRVNDAIVASGGATAGADLDRVNLAATIADGERLYIPTIGEDEPDLVVSDAGGTDGATGGAVNLNAADQAALETLPGVGPVTAATIVSHRDEHGSFATVDALVAVNGIGPATLERLREHVSVG